MESLQAAIRIWCDVRRYAWLPGQQRIPLLCLEHRS